MRRMGMLLGAALLSTGCGSGGGNPQSVVTETVTADASGGGGSNDEEFPPKVGDDALVVGETREGSALLTTLVKFERPLVDPSRYPVVAPNRDDEWMGIYVESCVKDSASRPIQLYADEWAAVGEGAAQYPATSDEYDTFPRPAFPSFAKVSPGQCVAGWKLVAVPDGVPIELIAFTPFDSPTAAEWEVDSDG